MASKIAEAKIKAAGNVMWSAEARVELYCRFFVMFLWVKYSLGSKSLLLPLVPGSTCSFRHDAFSGIRGMKLWKDRLAFWHAQLRLCQCYCLRETEIIGAISKMVAVLVAIVHVIS